MTEAEQFALVAYALVVGIPAVTIGGYFVWAIGAAAFDLVSFIASRKREG